MSAKHRHQKYVPMTKDGDTVIPSAKPGSWDDFFASARNVPKDFLWRRKDPRPQKRRVFK